jgi:hypothetical protein
MNHADPHMPPLARFGAHPRYPGGLHPLRRATGISIIEGGLALVSFDYVEVVDLRLDAYVNVVWEPLDGSQLSIAHLMLRLSSFMEAKGIGRAHLRLPRAKIDALFPAVMRHMIAAVHAIVDARMTDVEDATVQSWVDARRPRINMANIPSDDLLSRKLLLSAAETALYAADDSKLRVA